MKKSIFTILLFVLSSILCGFSGIQQEYIYRDLGEYVYNMPHGDRIGVKAYIVKSRNSNQMYSQYKNVFSLVAVSTSISRNYRTDTWLYNTRIYLNGSEISFNQFPYGLTVYVSTEPTSVYYWFTNDEDIGKYYLTWESSAYVPR